MESEGKPKEDWRRYIITLFIIFYVSIIYTSWNSHNFWKDFYELLLILIFMLIVLYIKDIYYWLVTPGNIKRFCFLSLKRILYVFIIGIILHFLIQIYDKMHEDHNFAYCVITNLGIIYFYYDMTKRFEARFKDIEHKINLILSKFKDRI